MGAAKETKKAEYSCSWKPRPLDTLAIACRKGVYSCYEKSIIEVDFDRIVGRDNSPHSIYFEYHLS
jgi:hypothetical protein